MITKLVFVLTCSEKGTYIEQALMSVWSAHHRNPDAHIVLLTDDKTNELLQGVRGEVLRYVSEKIVVPFEDKEASMMYRSRWIKTSARELVRGDFLFVDCDTICQHSLDEIDHIDCEIGAVLESHLIVNDYCQGLYDSTKEETVTIGVDLDEEKLYFSSGVILVRDTERTHRIYKLWHQYWMEGNEIGLKIDQPALAKANREMGHIIKQIPDIYNCILFTRPPFIREAHILHIAAYQNPSFLFSDYVLAYVKENGLKNKWLCEMILNPCSTIMPFDYNLKHSSFMERAQWCKELSVAWKGYGKYIDRTFAFFPSSSRLSGFLRYLLKHNCVPSAIAFYLLERRIRLFGKSVSYNYCQK